MKRVLGSIFKGWKISDYIISVVALLASIAILIVAKTVTKPAEIKEIFSAVQVVSALLLVWGVIFCSKDTIHGYVIGICTVGFFSYGLYVGDCFGSFIAAMLICTYLIFKLVMKCLNKEFEAGAFEKWDYLFLFGGLAVCAYPLYLLMDVLVASCITTEILVVLFMMAFIYLQFKKVRFAKLLQPCMAFLTSVSLVMILVQLRLENSGLLIGMLVLVAFEVVECVKTFLRKKEIKQD